MTEQELKTSLDAFYAGESTPEMEQELTRYFISATNVPDEFRADAAMFCAIHQSRAGSTPDSLETRIMNATVNRRKTNIRHLFPGLTASVAAAAAAILILTVGPAEPTSPYHEVTDPAEAGRIAMQVTEKLHSTFDKLTILNDMPL